MTGYPSGRDIREALYALGDTADVVAKTLHDGGWTGAGCDAHHCPIATFIRGTFPGCAATVGRSAVCVYPTNSYGQGVTVALPDPVRDFIYEFDSEALAGAR